jgi:hypothetical protein
MNVYILLFGLLLALAVLYFRYTSSYSKRLVQVGLTAAQTYVMFGDDAAYCAARTVSASMSATHKAQLVKIVSQIPTAGEGIDENLSKQRLSTLLDALSGDSSGVATSVALKRALKDKGEEWLIAVMKADLIAADKLYKDALVRNVEKVIVGNISKL